MVFTEKRCGTLMWKKGNYGRYFSRGNIRYDQTCLRYIKDTSDLLWPHIKRTQKDKVKENVFLTKSWTSTHIKHLHWRNKVFSRRVGVGGWGGVDWSSRIKSYIFQNLRGILRKCAIYQIFLDYSYETRVKFLIEEVLFADCLKKGVPTTAAMFLHRPTPAPHICGWKTGNFVFLLLFILSWYPPLQEWIILFCISVFHIS